MVNNSISTEEKPIGRSVNRYFSSNFLLGNIRAGLIVASVIPLAMLIAVILINILVSVKFNEPWCFRFWINCRWCRYNC
jgi:thiaminase